MAPLARLGLGAGIAGMMLALAVASFRHPPSTSPLAISATDAPDIAATNTNLAHCRVATMPETDCEAAWAARNRRFFGEHRLEKGDRP